MKISVLKSNTFPTTNWSGGTTTEIYIHPAEANYKKCNFDFRLSMAKVTDQESVFTSLSGIRRKLMVLDGHITLSHENHHKKQLRKFDVDTFNGHWKTNCIGSCIDFNLMMTGNTTGNLEGFLIPKNEITERDIPNGIEFAFVYNFSGETNIIIAGKSYCVNEGDLIIIEAPKPKTIQLMAIKKSTLVWGSIFDLIDNN